MSQIRYLKDESNNIILPVTHERAVKDSEGTSLETKLGQKQETLVSGANIKTINGANILGPGNINVADANAINGVSFNGTTAPISNKIAVVTASIPTELSQMGEDSDHRVVTDSEKFSWNAKQAALTFDSSPTSESYNPVTSDGVYSAVVTKESLGNKVTSLSSSSTNTQYPSALCVYNLITGLTEPFGYKIVSSLPSASASTVGDIYVVTDGTDTDFYLTAYSSGTYSWETLGSLNTSLTTITTGEIDSLF